jgi:hypothetical protein
MEKNLEPQPSFEIVCFSSYSQAFLSPLPLSSGLPPTRSRQPHSLYQQTLEKMTTIDGVMVLLPPPEGYVVDFDNPARQGIPDAYFVAGFGLAISFLFFMQRMYVKV